MKKRTVVGLVATIIIVNLLAIALAGVVAWHVYSLVSDKAEIYESARSYLSELPHNNSSAFVDYNIYKGGSLIKSSEELEDAEQILHMDKDYVYTRVFDNATDTTQIYRATHHFRNKELILDVRGKNFTMLDSDTILYKDDEDTVHQYRISDGSEMLYEDTTVYSVKYELKKKMGYYTCESISSGVYKITDKSGDIRLIEENDLGTLEDDEHFEELSEIIDGEMYIHDVCVQGERIFVWLKVEQLPLQADTLSIIYEYDFETEEYSFFDWIELYDYGNYTFYCLD